jgi:nucleotide sugar dehydrogenase
MKNHSNNNSNIASNRKVLVIGLGQIGYHNAEYFTSMGLTVDGYDISPSAIKRALDSRVISKSAVNFRGYDYYVICVSTHKPDNMFVPSLEGLFDVVDRISSEGKTDALVCLDSTLAHGTSTRIEEILKHRLHVCHVPHRFWISDKSAHGIRQTRVLGGCKPCCVQKAEDFYQNILEIPVYKTSTIEIAELSKIVENSYRFLEIAFAEELKIMCDQLGVAFEELRQAVNTKWNIKLLEVRDGIGGHCLPKDTQMYLNVATNFLNLSIMEAAKITDQYYKHAHLPKLMNKEMAYQNISTR